MEYAVRITRLWPATMNFIQRMKDVLAPMEEKQGGGVTIGAVHKVRGF